MLLERKSVMPPLWLAYPKSDRYSIGWRMGYGEEYKDRFFAWFETLMEEERQEYQELFPEPAVWKGWWEDRDTCELFSHGEYCIPFWRREGTPKYTLSGLRQEAAEGKRHEICLFFRHQDSSDKSVTKSCFSQWEMGEFMAFDRVYCCMEQFMMEQKAELFLDEEIRERILGSRSPKEIKAFGKKVRGFQQEVWDRVKYSIVLNGNWCKFSQNSAIRDFLLSTGDAVLAEASPYDAVWGIRLSENSPDARDPMKWRGQNLLGFALMEVRDELRRVARNEGLCDWSA